MNTEDKARIKKLAHEYRNTIMAVGITSVFVALKATGAIEGDFMHFLAGVTAATDGFLGYHYIKKWLNEETNKANQIERA